MRRTETSPGGLGLFLLGAAVGAATALLLRERGEKLKGLLRARHDAAAGHHDGRASLRRHRRSL